MRRAAARSPREPALAPLNGRQGCNGKRQYATHDEAHRVARNMRRHTDEPIGAYRCRHCQRWHLGTQTPTP